MNMKGKRLTVLEGGVLYLNTLLVKAKGCLIGCQLPTTQCPKPDLETAPFFWEEKAILPFCLPGFSVNPKVSLLSSNC